MAQAKSATVSRWNHEHPDRRRYITYRSMARIFILSHATREDIEKVKAWVVTREQDLDRASK